jgi:DNA repair protein RadA/Sms
VASSFLDRPIDAGTVVFGEIGLTGELRGISRMDIRLKEAARMGFTRCIMPRTISRELSGIKLKLLKIGNLRELLEHLF